MNPRARNSGERLGMKDDLACPAISVDGAPQVCKGTIRTGTSVDSREFTVGRRDQRPRTGEVTRDSGTGLRLVGWGIDGKGRGNGASSAVPQIRARRSGCCPESSISCPYKGEPTLRGSGQAGCRRYEMEAPRQAGHSSSAVPLPLRGKFYATGRFVWGRL